MTIEYDYHIGFHVFLSSYTYDFVILFALFWGIVYLMSQECNASTFFFRTARHDILCWSYFSFLSSFSNLSNPSLKAIPMTYLSRVYLFFAFSFSDRDWRKARHACICICKVKHTSLIRISVFVFHSTTTRNMATNQTIKCVIVGDGTVGKLRKRFLILHWNKCEWKRPI